jgi:hypothetical protein
MNITLLRHLLPSCVRRRRDTLLRVFAAVLAVTMLATGLSHTAPARAASTCTDASGNPVDCTPPALLNLYQLSQGLYSATDAQRQSLANLEQQAVKATSSDHGLASSDATAAQTWGRDDAEAELWALLVQAIQAPACSASQTSGQGCRTTDQQNAVEQNAVDWLTTVEQRNAIQSAEDSGLEYVKWAGLDQTKYQNLLAGGADESTLQTFFTDSDPTG